MDAGTGTGRIPLLISQMRSKWQIIAIDTAKSMLEVAAQHVQEAKKAIFNSSGISGCEIFALRGRAF